MIRRLLVGFLVCFALSSVGTAAQEKVPSGTDQHGKTVQPGEKGASTTQDPERVELKRVEQQFVDDNLETLRDYKKKYGGGNYHLERLKDPKAEFRLLGIAPTPEIQACTQLYYIDLTTKKKEVVSKYYYCATPAAVRQVGAYTSKKSKWLPLKKGK